MRLARAFWLMGMVVAALFAVPAAAAVYKCRAPDGKLLFSEVPCAPDAKPEHLRGAVSSYSSGAQADAYGQYLHGRAVNRLEGADARARRRMRSEADARRSSRGDRGPPTNADERRLRDAEVNRYNSGFYMDPSWPTR